MLCSSGPATASFDGHLWVVLSLWAYLCLLVLAEIVYLSKSIHLISNLISQFITNFELFNAFFVHIHTPRKPDGTHQRKRSRGKTIFLSPAYNMTIHLPTDHIFHLEYPFMSSLLFIISRSHQNPSICFRVQVIPPVAKTSTTQPLFKEGLTPRYRAMISQ